MSEGVLIREATAADVDLLLDFISRMGFNSRSRATWDGLSMGAMTAWKDGKLVGAVPFEPRPLQVGHQTYTALHETVVAVAPEFRSQGLGSRLQNALAAKRPGRADLLTVFREDPFAPAYRWYLRCGFVPAIRIESFLADEPAEIAQGPYEFSDPREHDALWCEAYAGLAGVVSRSARPISSWLPVHPYAGQYRFLHLRGDGAEALLGVGRMHSTRDRAEILLLAGDPEVALRTAAQAATDNDWAPLRFPAASSDPNAEVARSLRMRSGWTFDMLARSLTESMIDTAAWRYAGIDFA